MTAQPQRRPVQGSLPQPPMAPSPMPPPPPAPPAVAQGPARNTPDEVVARPKGPTRTAKVAVVLSALVAVAGISFSLGRLSVEETGAGPAAPFAADAGAFAGGPRGVAADTSAAGVADVASGDAEVAETVAALAAVEIPGEDAAVSATELTVATEAAAETGAGDAAAQPPGGAGGPADGGVFGGPPGGGGVRGGIEGEVSELTDTALVVTLADGGTQSVAIDTSTAWVEQQVITVADVTPGDTVSVQLPFIGPGADDEDAGSVATQVTVTTAAP